VIQNDIHELIVSTQHSSDCPIRVQLYCTWVLAVRRGNAKKYVASRKFTRWREKKTL
jgi:hypothetical protein